MLKGAWYHDNLPKLDALLVVWIMTDDWIIPIPIGGKSGDFKTLIFRLWPLTIPPFVGSNYILNSNVCEKQARAKL